MSGAFTVVFLFILAGIYSLFWLLFLILYITGRKRKSRSLSLLGGIPLILSSVFVATCVGSVAYGIFYNSKPANTYTMSFGFPPSADVKDIRSSYWYLGDTGSTYLRCNAATATIKKLAAKGWTRLMRQSLAEARQAYDGSPSTSSDDDTPAWRRPVVRDTTEFIPLRTVWGTFRLTKTRR